MSITKISPDVVDFDSALVVSPTLTIGDATAEDTKIVFAGDMQQTDLTKFQDKNGILSFVNILQEMQEMECIEFGINDIVRSGLI